MSWTELIKITCGSIANKVKNLLDGRGSNVRNFYGRLTRTDTGVMKTPEDVKREFDKSIKEVQGVPSDSFTGAREHQRYKRGFEEARRQAEQTAKQAAQKGRAWKQTGKSISDTSKKGI
ncbi:hypothetical protein ILUMI_02898 [Ignelater luminosus]|uniref:Uncharacterized protein n=1 Tax=Ignelater luminosus TaxID=2038154 RepID=A0A8K0DGU3_IGNLU|nr:hypothetical protein ILUMI_02898 [Ignelater luminosus]